MSFSVSFRAVSEVGCEILLRILLIYIIILSKVRNTVLILNYYIIDG